MSTVHTAGNLIKVELAGGGVHIYQFTAWRKYKISGKFTVMDVFVTLWRCDRTRSCNISTTVNSLPSSYRSEPQSLSLRKQNFEALGPEIHKTMIVASTLQGSK